jgi:hypothetical protein
LEDQMTDETKHTPGPWDLVQVGDIGGHYAPATSEGLSILTATHEGEVAFGAVYELADARLIAAAPEMLAALKFIASHDLGGTGVAQGVLQSMKTTAKEAIAKAEGRSK